MKKIIAIILACALVCSAALAMTSCGKSGDGDSVSDSSMTIRSAKAGSKFDKQDTTVTIIGVGDVSLGMTKDEVEAVLGKPKNIETSDTLGEVWYYQDYNIDVSFFDDVAGAMSAGALDAETVMLKSRNLYLDCTFDEVIAAFYDNGKKKRIDFIAEIKKQKLGDTLLKEYSGVDAYYLYGDLFDDSVTECGYVQHMPGDEMISEYDSIIYNYVELDEGSKTAGYYYTLSFDTYTDGDGTDRIGYMYLSREHRGE